MIKATELRIGNCIGKYNPSRVVGITGANSDYVEFVDTDGDKFGQDATDIEPIPLTQEILENAGFKVEYTNGGWLRWQKGEFKLLDRRLSHPQYHDVKALIIYVHQLQNLYFCLTGEELEIKL